MFVCLCFNPLCSVFQYFLASAYTCNNFVMQYSQLWIRLECRVFTLMEDTIVYRCLFSFSDGFLLSYPDSYWQCLK